MRSLSFKETANGLYKREFRLKQRNLELILFFESTCVKDIRKILLSRRKDNPGVRQICGWGNQLAARDSQNSSQRPLS